jgi:hypothetical protein
VPRLHTAQDEYALNARASHSSAALRAASLARIYRCPLRRMCGQRRGGEAVRRTGGRSDIFGRLRLSLLAQARIRRGVSFRASLRGAPRCGRALRARPRAPRPLRAPDTKNGCLGLRRDRDTRQLQHRHCQVTARHTTDLRAADPTYEDLHAGARHQGRCASLRDGLRPPWTPNTAEHEGWLSDRWLSSGLG